MTNNRLTIAERQEQKRLANRLAKGLPVETAKPKRPRKARNNRNADRIDGFDRDDLGLSRDF